MERIVYVERVPLKVCLNDEEYENI